MQEILDYRKASGEKLDYEIAAGTSMTRASVKRKLSELSQQGGVIMCRSILFKGDREIDSMRRQSPGFVPPTAPGGKSKPTSIKI